MFNNYDDDDDIELHYSYSRQDDYLHLQQVPDTNLSVSVNNATKKPIDDYMINNDGIKFTQPLPTNAKVKLSFTP